MKIIIAAALVAASLGSTSAAHADVTARPTFTAQSNAQNVVINTSGPDTRKCTTLGEYRRLKADMDRSEVEAILDGPGASMYGGTAGGYRMCNRKPGDALLLVRYREHRMWQSILFDYSDVNN